VIWIWEINLKPAFSLLLVKKDGAESVFPQCRSSGVVSACSFDGEEKSHNIIAILGLCNSELNMH